MRFGRFAILLFVLFGFSAIAGEVALTIDDLPFVGSAKGDEGKLRREHNRFLEILRILQEKKVPATGFVIAGSIEPGQWQWLDAFHQAGYQVGNHTYDHKSLARVSLETYKESIHKADEILKPLLSTPKYFRYPYLSEGGAAKKDEIREYLSSQGYVVAPVTIDTKDFNFNREFLNINWRVRQQHLSAFKQRYLNYVWSQTQRAEKKALKAVNRPVKHILLIHMSTLNSLLLGDLIDMLRSHGYQFISLDEALKDPYNQERAKPPAGQLSDQH